MNRLFVFVFLIFSTNLLAQRGIVGHYRDHFGDRIELYSDSTFKYAWSFDLQYSWTRGSWTIKKDTVFFHMVPVYDTLSYINANGLLSDKLILSVDEQPERIIKSNNAALQKIEKADVVAILQNTGGQNYQTYPTKLYFKKGRLYNIYQGSLVKKKVRGIWTRKKWRPVFRKQRLIWTIQMKRNILPYNPKLRELAKKLRSNMTYSEVKLWNELKNGKLNGYDFDRQRAIGNFIVDFYCKDVQLVIEIDGITHEEEKAKWKDAIRQKELEEAGIHFLRFDALLVVNKVEAVVREIARWLEEYEKENGVSVFVKRRREKNT